MTDKLQEFEALIKAATPGPWLHTIDWTDEYTHFGEVSCIRGSMAPDDARLICALRNNAEEFIAEIRRLREIASRTSTLYDAIAHGDDEHRAWLKAKLVEHFGEALEGK